MEVYDMHTAAADARPWGPTLREPVSDVCVWVMHDRVVLVESCLYNGCDRRHDLLEGDGFGRDVATVNVRGDGMVVIEEILDADHREAQAAQLERFARAFGLPLICWKLDTLPKCKVFCGSTQRTFTSPGPWPLVVL